MQFRQAPDLVRAAPRVARPPLPAVLGLAAVSVAAQGVLAAPAAMYILPASFAFVLFAVVLGEARLAAGCRAAARILGPILPHGIRRVLLAVWPPRGRRSTSSRRASVRSVASSVSTHCSTTRTKRLTFNGDLGRNKKRCATDQPSPWSRRLNLSGIATASRI